MLSGLAVACLTLGLLMLMFEESLIFFPAKYPEGFWNPPGLRYEDAWFTAADGARLLDSDF
jgi:hypothetical protein